MGKPSKRKQDKRKQRELDVHRKKLRVREQEWYSKSFPKFEIDAEGAPSPLVELVREAIRNFDFRTSNLFDESDMHHFKQLCRNTSKESQRDLKLLRHGDTGAILRGMKIGEAVYRLMPQAQLVQWLPFHDIEITPIGDRIRVRFDSLKTAKGNGGTIYYSPYCPKIKLPDGEKIVGWTRHSIDQLCARTAVDRTSYGCLGDVFAYLHHCTHFELCTLNDGKSAFTFFENCQKGFFSEHFVEVVLGKKMEQFVLPGEKVSRFYYRVGYCPIAIDAEFAVAKTLLFPGYQATPEHAALTRADAPRDVKNLLRDVAKEFTMLNLVKNSAIGLSLMKLFHDLGVPQVIETDEPFFRYR